MVMTQVLSDHTMSCDRLSCDMLSCAEHDGITCYYAFFLCYDIFAAFVLDN